MQEMKERQNDLSLNDYWAIIAKRKKFIISLLIVFVVITAVVSILMPKVYRAEFIVKIGESYAITNRAELIVGVGEGDARVQKKEEITTDGIIAIIEKPNNGKTEKIFAEGAPPINVLKVAKLKGFANKLKITIESSKLEEMETDIYKFVEHINSLSLIKEFTEEKRKAIAQRLKEIPVLIKEYNTFAQMYGERLKKRELSVINFVPAEFKEKAIALDNERSYLEGAMKNIAGVTLVDKPYISKTPVSPNIKKNIILAVVASFAAGVLLAFLVEYIEKVRNK